MTTEEELQELPMDFGTNAGYWAKAYGSRDDRVSLFIESGDRPIALTVENEAGQVSTAHLHLGDWQLLEEWISRARSLELLQPHAPRSPDESNC